MDISFDIKNSEGDQVVVALSCYDAHIVSQFSSDPLILALVFYDVTLIRKAGDGFVDYRILYAVSDTLAKFMDENEDAVICFYCDADTDVPRNHKDYLPQEYRSILFSRMFERCVKSRKSIGFINHQVEIYDSQNVRQFAHFICREEHKGAVVAMEQILKQK